MSPITRISAVIGTAGHIDHGKTSLVRALTGIDTDRLKEEKKRGLSIDIGFAYLDFDGTPSEGVEPLEGAQPPQGAVRFLRVPWCRGAFRSDVVGAIRPSGFSGQQSF